MGWLDAWRRHEESELLTPGGSDLDLRRAVIRHGPGARQALYARILQQEIYERSRCRLEIGGIGAVAISLSVDPRQADEGYQISSSEEGFEVVGFSERGLLFGVGRLLREMTLDHEQSYATSLSSSVFCPALDILSRPDYAMRQHQIAYRPKTNSYDAFSVEQMRQEILDQALFGVNAIEMIPPGLDDASQSPHFQVPWLTMLHEASHWCDQLDLKVSVWFPAFQEHAESLWDRVFSAFHRLDVLFVPGGDPGGRPASELFQIVELQASRLRERYFPQAEVWVSSQYGLGVSVDLALKSWVPRERLEEWLQHLERPEVKAFLTGVVYSPWTAMPLSEFRARVPQEYPVRNYPDICHSASNEFPVDGWDSVFFTTNLREGINPRPRAAARIIAAQAPLTVGCGCYSEGVNDDVNKFVWSNLHWGPDERGPMTSENLLEATLEQYAALLCRAPRHQSLLKGVIFDLEAHWENPLDPERVEQTRRKMVQVEGGLHNWRLNLLRLRAEYDAFVCRRFVFERELSGRALERAQAGHLESALELLRSPYPTPAAVDVYDGSHQLADRPGIYPAEARLQRWAALLFEQIGYQTSLGYQGQHRQRGAFFDMAWIPLHDLQYLRREFQAGRCPGPHQEAHFYASFGEGVCRGNFELSQVLPPYRKLEPGEDPTYFERPLIEHLASDHDEVLSMLCQGRVPRAWRSWLINIWPETARMTLRFPTDRLPSSGLRVGVTYLGRDLNRLGGDWTELGRVALPTRMRAGDTVIHDWLAPPEKTERYEFEIPESALNGEELCLTIEPEDPAQVTVNKVPLPVAELWLL